MPLNISNETINKMNFEYIDWVYLPVIVGNAERFAQLLPAGIQISERHAMYGLIDWLID